MRTMLVSILLLAAGCAGQPSAPPPQPAITYVNASGERLEQVSPKDAAGVLDAKRLVDAKKAGFTVVNKDGETLFCKTWDRTGSRILKDTQCLTAQQMDQWHAQTQQAMQEYMKTNAPFQGR